MPIVSLDCDVRSTDQVLTFSTSGTLEDQHLSFYDPNGEHHTITWDNALRYQKTGNAKMDYTFDPTKPTTGTYETNGLIFDFDIYTKLYIVSEGTIRITYTLIQAGDEINTTTISIDYTTIKEE